MKLFILPFIISLVFAQNKTIDGFGKAKKELRLIYGKRNTTFYCDCAYQKNSIKKKCGIKIKKFKKRSKRIEWEHIVPAHAFGQSFEEWRNSKSICPPKKNSKGKLKKVSHRKCAAKKSKLFRFMESDIYNLVPSVGSINALRSNYSMSDLKSDRSYCKTDFHIKGRKVSPPTSKKGDVARIYQYMDQAYPGRGIISKKNKKMFEQWAKNDPVDSQECELYFRKKMVQKSLNPILEKACQK